MISALDYSMLTNTTRYIAFGRSNNANNQAELTFNYTSNAGQSNALGLGLSGTTPMWINGYSRVGIGTSNPAYALDVRGTIQGTQNCVLNNATIGKITDYGDTWTAFANSLTFSAGNYALLQNTSGMTLLNSSAGQSLEFRIGNTAQAYINSSGRFIIDGGTTGGLYVGGYTVLTVGTYTYVAAGQGWGQSSGTAAFSIQATNRILCTELDVNSDERVKKNIIDIDEDPCLETVIKLKPKYYKRYDDEDSGTKCGFLAQDVEAIAPHCVTSMKKKVKKGKHKDGRDIIDEEINDFRCMDYIQLIPILTGAIKSLNKKIEGLEKEVEKLKKK
jgi:hypothetical protein